MTKQELQDQGIDRPDFCLVTGDAYIDHPSFGAAVIGRLLESRGFSVGVIAQPDWRSAQGFKALGRPKLGFLVTAGNIDSMVNHYTAAKKRRSSDAYTPGGQPGKRPDRATIVYVNRIREAYRNAVVIIGGIEASLRRFAHYDYWDNAVRRSVLIDSGADILIYGMAERALAEVAEALRAGVPVRDITGVSGTCVVAESLTVAPYETAPSYEDVSSDKRLYAAAHMLEQRCANDAKGKRLVQAHGAKWLIANPPAAPLVPGELDAVYALPYTRAPHPAYALRIPAFDEIEFSITSHRGCFGGCSFCALAFHQGRVIQARSRGSVLAEAERLTQCERFKGNIHDVGGPTANFRRPACPQQVKNGVCGHKQCIVPRCPNLVVSHTEYTRLLRDLRALPGVKRVFVRSGVRFDYVMYDKNPEFLEELCAHHISGQLKVAPEHVNDTVLELMGKPEHAIYERFLQKYQSMNRKLNKNQYIVPYFMSSHPGSDLHAAIELACYLKETGQRPEQVQDFYPTPGTLSTAMFYTEMDPRTMRPVYVPRSAEEKAMQRALLQFHRKENAAAVRKALIKAERQDLIGRGKRCLVTEAIYTSRPKNRPGGGPKTGAKQPPSRAGGARKRRGGR